MDYILIGNDKDVTNVLKEQRIRINRGMIQLIPISECGLVTEEDARKTLECMLAEKNEEMKARIAELEVQVPSDEKNLPVADSKDLQEEDAKEVTVTDDKAVSVEDEKKTGKGKTSK